jgi:hypothetical protein
VKSLFKLLRSPRIDSKEPITVGRVALTGRYDNPVPTRFLAPIGCLKIPAQFQFWVWFINCFFFIFSYASWKFLWIGEQVPTCTLLYITIGVIQPPLKLGFREDSR